MQQEGCVHAAVDSVSAFNFHRAAGNTLTPRQLATMMVGKSPAAMLCLDIVARVVGLCVSVVSCM
jgi:hypothetical protein